MFGLSEGSTIERGQIGWGSSAEAGTSASGIDQREAILMPYLQAFANYRDTVRSLARKEVSTSKASQEILALCDRLRDEELIELGVALEDHDDGRALVKLVPAEKLRQARDKRLLELEEKAARKKEEAAKKERKRLEELFAGRTPPEILFRNSAEFEGFQFDDDGVPLRDDEGKELANKRRKKLLQEREKQAKLHAKWIAAGRPQGET